MESRAILVNDLRKFGRVGSVRHQPIDGFDERGRRGKKFDTHKEAVTLARDGGLQMADAGVGHCRLSVEDQADRLDRLDRKGLLRLDQGSMMVEVMNPDGIARVERSPERSKHFEPNSGPTVSGRSHHRDTCRIGCAIRSPEWVARSS